jgi:putative ABC transport system permease protein
MTGLLQDVRYGLRRLRRSPVFTAIAVLTLALGIGANTAIFSLADLIIRKPVALPEMDRLAVVDEQVPGSEDRGISPANYLDLRSASESFEHLAAYEYWSASDNSQGQPQELRGVRVSANFFSAVGVKPMLGRDFLAGEESLGQDDEILISNALWKQRFGSDLNAVGATLKLDGKPYTVIGVLPPKATFPLGAPAFWMPLTMDSRMRSQRGELVLNAVGCLRSGISLDQARSEIEAHWRHLAELYPESNRNRSIETVRLHDSIVLDYNRQFALLLTGIVGLVLLIACTNLAAVQLARAAKRQTEIAVRAALGASRRLLFRELLVESMVVALAGGCAGTVLAVYGVDILRKTLPSDVRWFCDVDSLSVSAISLLFTTSITIAAGLLSGLLPAWRSSKVEISGALAEGAVRIAGRRSHFWRAVLLVSETATATVLLIAAALMTKGFAVLANGPSPLAPSSLLTFHISLPPSRYADAQHIRAFEERLLDQLKALPNVRWAALASGIPYSSYENSEDLVVRDSPLGPNERPVAMLNAVSSNYFRSMQIALRAGREFDSGDMISSMPVCIISQSMAQRLWPGQSALGKQIKLSDANAAAGWITVAGVAEDVQHEIYDRSFRSILYLPAQQSPPLSADFVIRSERDPLQLAAAIRSEIRELDADLPVERLQSLSELIHSQASALQYVAGLMTAFALLGLVLACVGVYGIVANSVTERWRELALCMALGAHSWKLFFTVLGRALFFSATGMSVGLLLSLVFAKLLSGLIYGVSAWDAGTFLSVPLILSGVTLAASYAPARRAIRMDPMVALRYE